MRNLLRTLFLILAISVNSYSAVYNVTRADGDITAVGTFAYALAQINGTMGPHTINFNLPAGTRITHTGGPGDYREPWTISANWTAPTAANMITINGNDCVLTWDDYMNTDACAPNYGIHALTIAASFVTINDLGFEGSPGATNPLPCATTWPPNTNIVYEPGAGVVISDVNSFLTNDAINNGWPTPGTANFSNLSFNRCDFSNNGSTGIFNSTWVPAAGTNGWEAAVPLNSTGVSDIFIDDCLASNNGLSGIQFSHADNVNITNTTSRDNGDHGIYLTGDTYNGGAQVLPSDIVNSVGVTNSLVQGNTCTGNGTVATTGAGIVIERLSNNILIEDNNCSTNSEHGVWLRANSDDNIIQNNQCNDNGYNGAGFSNGINLSLGGNDNNIIQDNTSDGNETNGIYLVQNSNSGDNSGNQIRRNIVVNNVVNGIEIINSTGNMVEDNLIGTTDGITAAGNGVHGIILSNGASQDTVRNNVIIYNGTVGVGGDGVHITEGILLPATTTEENDVPPTSSRLNIVQNNRVGLDINDAAAGNIGNGVYIFSSNNNLIGGTTTDHRNYVGSNGENGVVIDDGDSNRVSANLVGVDSLTGIANRGNTLEGIIIRGGGNDNIIGGTTVGERNYVANNTQNGISLDNAGSGNLVIGNVSGLGSDGTTVLGNGFNGINITTSNGNQIGGSTADSANYTSGNTFNGVQAIIGALDNTIIGNNIGLDVNGVAVGNTLAGVLIRDNSDDNNVVSNVIAASGQHAIHVHTNSDNQTIQGNFIGANSSGDIVASYANTGNGIFLNSSNNNVIGGGTGEGNVVVNNSMQGILIDGVSDANNILGNKIGIDNSGSAGANTGQGIQINNATNTTIGGTGTDEGNVVSNHIGTGILLSGADVATLIGNKIGTSLDGNTAAANGLGISISGSTNIVVGGSSTNERNIISGNSNGGIQIDGAGSTDNTIQGNYIGIGASGAAVPNSVAGVIISGGATQNTIGGSNAGERNIISGNSGDGISVNNADGNSVRGNYIGTNVAGTAAIANTGDGIEILGGASGNIIDSANVISGNGAQGIYVQGAGTDNNVIKGNTIGLNAAGTAAIGNTFNGVFLENGASGTVVGGGLVSERNVISGNNQNGVGANGASNNIIAGNYVGTDVTGSTAIGNVFSGLSFISSTNNTIGGVGADSSNVISGNNDQGIYIVTGSTGNTIRGNVVGLNAAGTDSLANFNNGVFIDASSNQTFVGNTISGNGHGKSLTSTPVGHGVLSTSSSNLTFLGNNIGTDITGTIAFGNAYDGLNLSNADGTVIGGIGAGERNIISGNGGFDPNNAAQFCTGGQRVGDGIRIANSANIEIANNYIGISSDNNQLGNNENGIDLTAVTNSTVGGATAAHGNVISSNIYKGMVLNGANNNDITANLIGTDANGVLDYGNGTGETGPWLWSAPACSPTFIGGAGILTIGSSDNTIGGAGDLRNVISGNTEGIWMQQGSNTNTVDNNLIGTDITGDVDLGNDTYGIYLAENNTGNVIGTAALGNVISGNGSFGVYLTDWSAGNTGTVIEGNNIGLGLSGTALGNDSSGVYIGNLSTTTTVRGNTISANGKDGIEITTAAAQTVVDNRIGTDVAGTATIGNTRTGVFVSNSTSSSITNNTIGGSINGIELSGATTTTIQSNYIGTDVTSASNLANSNAGILITSGTNSDVSSNTIAYSSGDGVIVTAGTGNEIVENSMFCNTTPGGGAPSASAQGSSPTGTGITLNGGNNNFLNPQDFSNRRPLIKTVTGEMVIPLGAGSNASSISGLSGSTVHIYAYDDRCQNCQPRTYTGESVVINASHFAAGAADTAVTIPISGGIDPSANTYVVIVTDASGNSSQVSGCSVAGCTPPTAAFTTFPGTGDLIGDSLLVVCQGTAAEGLEATDDATVVDEHIEWFTIDINSGDTTSVQEGTNDFNYTAAIPAPGDTVGYVFLTYPDNVKECYNVSDTLYITSIPNVEVEIDADQVLCEDSIYTLSADTVRNWSTFDWTVSAGATGIFSSATDALHPSYTVGDADLGTVTITLDATGLLPSRGAACGTETISMDITTHQRPEVDAGDDIITICPGSTLDLTSITTPSSESNTTSIAWTDSIGTGEANGSFSSPSTIATDYTVAVQDSGQTVRLVVTGTGNAVCPVAQDFLDITVKDSTRFIIPISDTTICDVTTLDLAGIGTYNTKNDDNYIWSVTPNEGTLTTSTSARPTYTPAATPSASVVLTADVTGTAPTHGSGTCHIAQDQVTVNINPTPTVEAGTLPATQCSGTNVVLGTGASATGTDSFTWSHDGSGSWQGGDNTILAAVYVPDAIADAGNTVTFTLNGVSSCGNPTDNVSIDLLASPSSEAGDNGVICEGSTFTTVGSSAANGAVNRTWMLDNPRTGTVGGGAGAFSATNNDITTYTPDASDYGKTIYLFLEAEGPVAGTCQFVYDSLALTINEQATVADMPDQAVCLGDVISFGSLSPAANATNYTSIAWSGGQPAGWTIPAGDTLNATYEPSLADGASTTVTLTVTALPQCTDVSDDVAITIGQAPQVTLNPATLCEDGTQSVSALIASEANTTGASTYTWTPAADVSGDTYTPPTGSGGTTQTLTLEVTEPSAPAACQTRTFTVDLQIDALPTLTIGGPYQMCIDESFTIPATDIVVNPSSLALTWAASGNAGSNTNETYTSVAADAGNTVTMTATTADNGTCSGVSAFTQIEVYGLPTPSIFGSSDVCANQVSSFTMPSAPAASSYVWSVTQGLSQSTTTTLQPGDGVDIDFTGATGQVTVTVEMTDQFGCVNTTSLPVDVTESFIPEFEINEPQGCTGDNMTFNLTNIVPNSANNSFAWYLNDDTGTPLQTGNGTTLTINTLQPGDRIIVNYTVDPLLNCADATTPSSNYTEWSNPDINIRPATPVLTGGGVVCAPLATTASADVAGSRMEWYINNDATPLAVGQNFDEVLSEGAYTLRYEVANGPCAASSTIQAVVDRAQVTASATSDDLEEGEFTVLSSKHNTLNQSYTYNWENLSHDEVIPAFNQKNDVVVYPTESTTTYRVTATTSNGCEATDDVDINVFVFCEPENVFTPNGDDVNDTWNLDCLNDGSFPQAVVTIYNRWGDVVYKDDRGYIEPWDGTRNGEPMPVATYWYVIEFNVRGKVLHGSVTILR